MRSIRRTKRSKNIPLISLKRPIPLWQSHTETSESHMKNGYKGEEDGQILYHDMEEREGPMKDSKGYHILFAFIGF